MSSSWDDLPEELADAFYVFMTHAGSMNDEILKLAIMRWVEKNIDTCAAMLYAGTYYDQPEYCDELAEPGREFCPLHHDPEED